MLELEEVLKETDIKEMDKLDKTHHATITDGHLEHKCYSIFYENYSMNIQIFNCHCCCLWFICYLCQQSLHCTSFSLILFNEYHTELSDSCSSTRSSDLEWERPCYTCYTGSNETSPVIVLFTDAGENNGKIHIFT